MSASTGYLDSGDRGRTFQFVNVRLIFVKVRLILLTSVLGLAAVGCGDGGGDSGNAQFRERTVPYPKEIDEMRRRACILDNTQIVREVFDDSYLPGVAQAGDAPCFLPSDSYGGGALFDFSGDGRLDIIGTNALFGPPNFLENLGDWKFRDVSDIVIGENDWRGANGVAIGDMDNDGDGDIFFTRQGKGRTLLLLNEGGGYFVEVAKERGVDMEDGAPHFGESAVFGDYDGDGWLDLHTTENRPVELSPRESLAHARLFRNLGGEGKPGYFEDVTVEAGTPVRLYNGALLNFTSAFHYINDDRHLDLHIISDFSTSLVFLNNGDGTFRNGSTEMLITYDESGMGLSIGDISGDGRPDIFISAASQVPAPVGDLRTCEDLDPVDENMGGDGNTGNRLYIATDDGYVDMTDSYGVRHGGWGWGTIMTDFPNSGRLSIVQVASRSLSMDASILYCLYKGGAQPVVRYWEQDAAGHLNEVSYETGIRGLMAPKSPLAGDLDGDGDEDLVIFESASGPKVYENTTAGASGRSLTFRFGPKGHAANAKVTVSFSDGSPDIVRIAGIQNGLYSARYADLVVGLGDRAELVSGARVEYATGEVVELGDLRPGERVVLP